MLGIKSKQKKQTLTIENQLERVRGLAGATAQVAQDELTKASQDAWKQLLGLEQQAQKLSGELHAGESLDVAGMETKGHSKGHEAVDALPGLDYHHQFSATRESHVSKEHGQQVQAQIDQILFELKKLANSSQELAVQFEEVTMEQMPENAGTYHLNFFEWVFAVIQKARERIEESQTWLSLFKSKKGEKNYWNMFKKHGTSFGLSNERVVATQTG